MRVALVAILVALPVWGQAAPMDCAAQAEFVMGLVEGRAAGTPRDAAEASATEALDAEAGGMLVEWIYTLPEAQLTEEVGTAWKTQCEAL
ncbi:hypothetical protein [Tropicibacter alexandrii]|uniref:hypothetical protein n=1 Tax=Tropicibacter alexandrii TaxID=2267683 RepID=UPI000EF4C298|nr:hypothetical protein [Tropicibacter alexandrii]